MRHFVGDTLLQRGETQRSVYVRPECVSCTLVGLCGGVLSIECGVIVTI